MSRPKVVVVDDDDAVRFTLEEALEAAFDVVPLARAQDALAHAAEADAVLTDLVMPDKDGLWLTAELRELDRTLPVILLTAHGSERIAVQAMRAGAYDYLSKPGQTRTCSVTSTVPSAFRTCDWLSCQRCESTYPRQRGPSRTTTSSIFEPWAMKMPNAGLSTTCGSYSPGDG